MKRYLPWMGLGLVVLLAYWRALGFEFISLDDGPYIYDNTFTKLGLNSDTFVNAWRSIVVGHWHPLTMLGHLFDVTIFGLNPMGHHLHNILLHLFNSLALYWLLAWTTKDLLSSLLVALIFAIHPLNIESVVWVSQRKTLLSSAFWFASLLAYVKFSTNEKLNAHYFTLSLLLFYVGLLAKPLIVMLPLTLLLFDFWPLKRFPKKKLIFLVKEKWPFYAGALVFSLLTIIVQKNSGAINDLPDVTHFDKFINATISYWRYFFRFFYPNPLAIHYPFPERWNIFLFLLAAIALIASLLLTFRFYKKYPTLAFGWIWFLATMVTMVGYIHVGAQAIADRYMYIPMIGLALILSFGFVEIFPVRRKFIHGLLFVWVGFLLILHIRYLPKWQNSEMTFRHALEVAPNNFLMHNNLAVLLNQTKRYTEAKNHIIRSLELRPKNSLAETNLGNSYSGLEQFDLAKQAYERALSYNPKSPEANIKLALAYRREKDYEKTLYYLDQALKYRLRDWKAVQAKGETYLMLTSYEKAVEYLEDALNYQNVDNSTTHFNLSVAYRRLDKIDVARLHYEQALKLNPALQKLDSPFRDSPK